MDVTTLRLAWDVLDGLDDDLQELARGSTRITDYAARWICRPDGFAPSPICVLRPLAEVMDLLREEVDRAGLALEAEWNALRTALAAAGAGFADVDAATAAFGDRLIDALGEVA